MRSDFVKRTTASTLPFDCGSCAPSRARGEAVVGRQAHEVGVQHRRPGQMLGDDRFYRRNSTCAGTPPTASKLCARPIASAPKRSEQEKLTVR